MCDSLGQFVLLPDRRLYEDGLRVITAGFHGVQRGWNGTGPPVALLGTKQLRRRDGGTFFHNGAPAVIDDKLWTFAGAETDQGLFSFMLLYRHGNAARFAHNSVQRPVDSHRVTHCAGGGPRAKPWNKAVARSKVRVRPGDPEAAAQACPFLRYVLRLDLPPHSASSDLGWCARALRRAQDRLASQVRIAALPRFPWCLTVLEPLCNAPAAWSWPFSLL
eukprot:6074263-Prymnesium_polylepis.3